MSPHCRTLVEGQLEKQIKHKRIRTIRLETVNATPTIGILSNSAAANPNTNEAIQYQQHEW